MVKKNFHKWRLSVLTIVALVIMSVQVFAAAAPNITADGAIVVDTTTGKTLYEKNADKREYPASTTKIMTCILGIESGRPDRIVEVSSSAADVESTRLYPGEQLRLQDMMRQMMLISDNGCATAVGETLAQGDIDHFAQMMNDKAASLGMTNTHFVNANGMPDSNHYTTARDMSKLMSYALKNAEFRKIIGTNTARIYYIKPSGHTEYCENTNDLLRTYTGCVGGKTGWTSAARGCLVVAADRDGHELEAVVFHSYDDDTHFSEAAALLDYGFAQLQNENMQK